MLEQAVQILEVVHNLEAKLDNIVDLNFSANAGKVVIKSVVRLNIQSGWLHRG